MKVVILAGGYGTRLGNITEAIPKPMVLIGEKPIIWHIMKTYSHFGFRDFIISLGYKADVIKEYFYNYQMFANDFKIQLGSGKFEVLKGNDEQDWNVSLVYTGLKSLKGARIKRLAPYLDDLNMATYGDGVADIDIADLLSFHKAHGRIITITGVYPPARFGEVIEDQGRVISFREKPQTSVGLINGGFMVFDKRLLDYLTEDESCDLEYGAFDTLVRQDQVQVYKHQGSWECVDNERDLVHLNKLWHDGKAFWKKW